MQEVHPFGSTLFDEMRYLIVGTFPGRKYSQRSESENKADERAFSYGGRNQLWPILEKLYDVELHTRSDKIALLRSLEIGMMDLYQVVERKKDSNLDQHLTVLVDNKPELERIIKTGHIKAIFCTGKQVALVLKKWFPDEKHLILALPSPSPAYCVVNFNQKVAEYRVILPPKSLLFQ